MSETESQTVDLEDDAQSSVATHGFQSPMTETRKLKKKKQILGCQW